MPLQDGRGDGGHLAIEADAANTCRSRLAFDGFMLCRPRFHSSFASRVRWVCAVLATISTHRSRLAFDRCVRF